MSKKALRDYGIAIGTFLLAGGVWKWTKSMEVTAAMCGAAGLLVGRLMKQPDYAKMPEPPKND